MDGNDSEHAQLTDDEDAHRDRLDRTQQGQPTRRQLFSASRSAPAFSARDDFQPPRSLQASQVSAFASPERPASQVQATAFPAAKSAQSPPKSPSSTSHPSSRPAPPATSITDETIPSEFHRKKRTSGRGCLSPAGYARTNDSLCSARITHLAVVDLCTSTSSQRGKLDTDVKARHVAHEKVLVQEKNQGRMFVTARKDVLIIAATVMPFIPLKEETKCLRSTNSQLVSPQSLAKRLLIPPYGTKGQSQ